MKKPTIDYYEWVQQLKVVAREQHGFTDNGITKTDWDAFKDYYVDGYTPAEALAEDSSYA